MRPRHIASIFLVLVPTAIVAIYFHLREDMSSQPKYFSRLWGASGEHWDQGGRLGDFSFAGYGMGDRALPRPEVTANVLDFGARGDGQSDDSEAFIKAITSVERGAILIPAGRYLLTSVLRIDRPGLVLRGEGAGRTVLYFPKPLGEILGPAPRSRGRNGHWSWGGGFLWLSGQDRGVQVATVIQPAQRGEQRLQLSTTAGLAPGQTIRLVQKDIDGSLLRHLHTRSVESASDLLDWADGRLIDFATPIDAIEEDSIVLKRPLPVDVRLNWAPIIYSHTPSVTEVGIEDLTIQFEPKAYAGHLVEDGYNGIFLENVAQFWIQNVEILDADSGIVSDGPSRFGTISNLRLANDHRHNTITGHHGISLEGPKDILVTGFRIETRFRHDLTVGSLSSGNVFSKGRGTDLCFDHHTGAPHDNLFTDIDAGAGNRLWARGGPKTGWGPHSAARQTFWNIRALAKPAAPLPDYPRLTLVALTGANDSPYSDHWVEALDPTYLRPQDLHLAQLRKRMSDGRTSP